VTDEPEADRDIARFLERHESALDARETQNDDGAGPRAETPGR
jgi:hypothetical protein